MSAAWKIKTGRFVDLSGQQILDCSTEYGNLGCRGGNMEDAFEYAKMHELCMGQDYPYTASADQMHCRGHCKVGILQGGIGGYYMVPANDEEALLHAVALKPVVAGIEAEHHRAFQFYQSGILSGACGRTPNHGILHALLVNIKPEYGWNLVRKAACALPSVMLGEDARPRASVSCARSCHQRGFSAIPAAASARSLAHHHRIVQWMLNASSMEV